MTVPNASMGAGETEAMTRHTGCGFPSLVGRDILPWGLALHVVRVRACVETPGHQITARDCGIPMDPLGEVDGCPRQRNATRGHEKEERLMPWVSIREASEMLQVSLRTVQRLAATHTLPSRMEKGRRLVRIGADEDRAGATLQPVLTPTLLPHLFDLLEGFTTLRRLAHVAVAEAQALAPLLALPSMEGAPSVAHWQGLCDRVVTCHQLVVRLVEQLRLDQPVLYRMYRALITIQFLWTAYEARSGEPEPTSRPQAQESNRDILIAQLIAHVRALLLGCVKGQELPDGQQESGEVS